MLYGLKIVKDRDTFMGRFKTPNLALDMNFMIVITNNYR